jgi:flagellar biosynthesis GTPase FlhF
LSLDTNNEKLIAGVLSQMNAQQLKSLLFAKDVDREDKLIKIFIEKSTKLLEQQIKDKPEDAHLHLKLANLLVSIGKVSDGIKNYEKATQLDPNIKANVNEAKELLKIVQQKEKEVQEKLLKQKVEEQERVELEKKAEEERNQRLKEQKRLDDIAKNAQEKKLKEEAIKQELVKKKELEMKKIMEKVKEQDITKIFELVAEGNQRISGSEDEAIFLLGKTGAGKSTLAHALSGKALVGFENDDEDMVIKAKTPLETIKIGDTSNSETTIPNKCYAKDGDKKIVVW